MAETRFDEIIHAPVRLRICGLLRPVDHLDFAVLRDTLSVSDATLSKHLKTLATSGYVTSRKTVSAGRDDARRITWLALTRAGRTAFDAHVRALQEIATPSI
ncbi:MULTISPECIES: transcriptional regulator [unclassified Cryobacterium]|uniref:transcriptional regulator n=1 Tax=unclassified Cryobacterium TaxID=2649013 RepID=UPI00106A3E3B|nr:MULTISPECIES: transcriptional regulator [unclassified Cryobacterium]TFC55224.1 transcriptional regulator [Cryobacterium sp. TMB3-1-2]TFC74901.1 transcriptional regulator [Cryobacterium sp. TMB3-15]TFC77009.1 transcriptional regulator [Cryobacterium sp. TMB3-10]TFD37335.1 transcriptional regulator [Cryobacterium sp. TMB3-12]